MSPNKEELPVEWLSSKEIRIIFNKCQYYEKIKSGELIAVQKKNSHPNPPPNGEPFCTYSQILYYFTKDHSPVAIIHQYLRPDGTIGASGLPDPKRIILPDRILAVRAKAP